MPLENNAKISDVITALSDMQGINQKAELASVIGAPAEASDNVATQITKLQDAKDVFAEKIGVENTMPLQAMADVLVVGKKWASGTITSASSSRAFTATGGGSQNSAYCAFDMSAIPFVPSVIVFLGNLVVPVWTYDNTYYQDSNNYANSFVGNASLVVPYINGVMNIPVGTVSKIYNWIAFE